MHQKPFVFLLLRLIYLQQFHYISVSRLFSYLPRRLRELLTLIQEAYPITRSALKQEYKISDKSIQWQTICARSSVKTSYRISTACKPWQCKICPLNIFHRALIGILFTWIITIYLKTIKFELISKQPCPVNLYTTRKKCLQACYHNI